MSSDFSSGRKNSNSKLPPEVNRILYVRNLPFNITAEELYAIFGKYGAVFQIRQGQKDKDTKGTAFVVYEDIYDAKAAVDHLSGFNVGGRYLVVLYYQPAKFAKRQAAAEKQAELDELRKQVAQKKAALSKSSYRAKCLGLHVNWGESQVNRILNSGLERRRLASLERWVCLFLHRRTELRRPHLRREREDSVTKFLASFHRLLAVGALCKAMSQVEAVCAARTQFRNSLKSTRTDLFSLIGGVVVEILNNNNGNNNGS
eukprot:CAMPEP_0194047824 /NCGR_PEP_ID=MMETSP0009_2-20130614/25649_1 /TAXON_ID=210454 /ORGANISM="Grammatophora oceanica, Strain CCMP 410" /LENGTH=258 /DNA_ID=CAMNT_0038693541 /DNA_START=90 /DNA_END=864 /DNA_ORIENTATION=+